MAVYQVEISDEIAERVSWFKGAFPGHIDKASVEFMAKFLIELNYWKSAEAARLELACLHKIDGGDRPWSTWDA